MAASNYASIARCHYLRLVPDTTFIDVAGKRLEARRIAGPPGRPTIVFLHEGLGSVSAWRDFPDRLAREMACPALVYSRAGYGHSSPAHLPRAPDFMHVEARSVLPALLAAEGVEQPILFGHSDGASIALLYAALPGSRVRALVLEAPHVLVEQVCAGAIADVRREYSRSDLRDRLARHHADPDAAFYGWADAWLRPEFRRWNIEDALPHVRAPALVIQGDRDEYGTIAQVEAIERGSGGPVERLWLPGVGHRPHRERPDEILTAAVRFLQIHS
jgi:pimeloyl-ACP methyl ester carboxylesterase